MSRRDFCSDSVKLINIMLIDTGVSHIYLPKWIKEGGRDIIQRERDR